MGTMQWKRMGEVLGQVLGDVVLRVFVLPSARRLGQKLAEDLGRRGLEEIVSEVRKEYPMGHTMAAVILAAIRAGGDDVLGEFLERGKN